MFHRMAIIDTAPDPSLRSGQAAAAMSECGYKLICTVLPHYLPLWQLDRSPRATLK